MNHYKHNVLLLVLAAAFVAVFSYNTSPLYQGWGDNTDSSIFYLIGKYWTQGALPYVDLWDLKGPFIFFVNAVGYWLTGSRVGVSLLQVVSLWLTLVFVYRILRTRFSVKTSYVLTLFTLASLAYTYSGGNLTEEYVLPLMAGSLYGVLTWLSAKRADTGVCPYGQHPVGYAFVYGATVGVSLMSRLTNALPLCGAVAVVAVVLLRGRQLRNLLACVAAGVGGLAVVVLPFVAYFHAHGALTQMWDGTFLYAARYAAHATKDVSAMGWHYFVLSYLNSIVMALVGVALLVKGKGSASRVRGWTWLMAALMPLAWFCQGNGFGNYGTTVLPLLPIAMVELSRLHLRPLLAVLGIVVVAGCASKVRYMWHLYHWTNPEVAAIREFLDSQKTTDYHSFVAYNCTPYIYQDLDVRPAAPYFTIQDFAIGRNEGLRDDVVDAFRRCQPEWILVNYDDEAAPAIQPLLDKRYRLQASDTLKHLRLYERAGSAEASADSFNTINPLQP